MKHSQHGLDDHHDQSEVLRQPTNSVVGVLLRDGKLLNLRVGGGAMPGSARRLMTGDHGAAQAVATGGVALLILCFALSGSVFQSAILFGRYMMISIMHNA